ncbi:MAG: GNAT family N-acetyltransferase [Clostridiales bacterium]|nr:GNAT family N-acetyltransferase [Clostridiales bacterium]
MNKREIFVTADLNKQQVADLIKLESTSNDLYDIDLKFHEADFESISFHICSYKDNKLIGYFALTENYIKDEFLLWGTVHPDFENLDHINEMLKVGLASDSMKDTKTIKILNNSSARSMKTLYCDRGATHQHTVYDMRYKGLVDINTENIDIREATIEDLDTVCKIGVEAFSTSEEDEVAYNTGNINNDRIHTYIASTNGCTIGIVSVMITDESSSIADLAVVKEHRKKGYGRSILSLTISELLKKNIKNIRLGVETSNVNALNIYKAAGFETHHSTEWLLLELKRKSL